jgi:hypothetical protein
VQRRSVNFAAQTKRKFAHFDFTRVAQLRFGKERCRSPRGWRGATYAPYKQSLANGRIGHNERALLFTSATSVKYPLPTLHRTLDISKEIDFHGALVLD